MRINQSLALLADLVPADQIGKATGVLAASGSIAAPLASFAAGATSDAFGIRAIFGLMALMTIAALSLLPAVRTPDSAPPLGALVSQPA